jgi:hypothetical protein
LSVAGFADLFCVLPLSKLRGPVGGGAPMRWIRERGEEEGGDEAEEEDGG